MADAPGLLERLDVGAGDLRRGLPLRARAARLPAGRRVRPRGRARAPGEGDRAPPRVRPRRARTSSRRSPTTPTARSCGSSAGSTCSSASTARRSSSPGASRARPGRCSPATSATRTSTPARRRATTVRGMFEEQVGWAADAGVDFVIGETFSLDGRGARRARGHQGGGPARGRHPHAPQRPGHARRPGVADACRALEAAGADVVGLNCARGPDDDAAAARGGPRGRLGPRRRAAGPVPHARGRAEHAVAARPAARPATGAFPIGARPVHLHPPRDRALHGATRSRSGVDYLGVCCGAAPAPHPGDGRGDRPHAAREPVLGRHVQARVPRHRPDAEDRVPGLRAAALIGAVDVPPMMRG